MKNIALLLLVFCFARAEAQKSEEPAIRKLLQTQTESWNKGDIEGFMQTYWKNDSLMFIGKSGLTRGWQNTWNNYKKAYPDTAAMGQLFFDIIEVNRLSAEYYFVVGKWMLKRSVGDLSGHYTLVLRRRKGQWKIIADHSS